MELLAAALLGFVLDLLLGDPPWMPHPVVLMGRCITALEGRLRALFPATPRGELAAGGTCRLTASGGALCLESLPPPRAIPAQAPPGTEV